MLLDGQPAPVQGLVYCITDIPEHSEPNVCFIGAAFENGRLSSIVIIVFD